MPECARKRQLKDDVIPTLFAHKTRSTQRPAIERRKRKAFHEEVSHVICYI